MSDIFRGKLVRITSESPKDLGEPYARWSLDSEFWRLMDSGITRPFSAKATEKFLEEMLIDPRGDSFLFSIRTLEDDRMVGDIGLGIAGWPQADAFVGIALGDRNLWGKGYGTDAMNIILRYAFQELNLRRVTLNVFEYNPRAVRSYEKVGFRQEGRVRGALLREGRRWDMLYMGISRQEWLAQNALET
jgi:RimJ/RimL family protein N-acetyltransferase